MAKEDDLIEILETFEYPVFRQGSMSEDEAYPDTFFTFWNTSEDEHSPYDDDTIIVEYNFDIYVYSNDPERAYSLLSDARSKLKQAGWIIMSRGYDVESDQSSHIGRGMAIAYLETLSINQGGQNNA